MSENRKSAALILADGTVYRGVSFGAAGTVFGEIVFTTGVSGFQETLTDPSNFGQIVVRTTMPPTAAISAAMWYAASPSCLPTTR